MPTMNSQLMMPQFGDQQFQPEQIPQIAQQPAQHVVSEPDPVMDLVNKLYTPGHEVSDKFNKVWSEMPQREKPGVLRKIVASMVGLKGGVKGADDVLYGGYNQKMDDWTTKLKMLQPLLTDERYDNANNRQMATGLLNRKRDEDRFDLGNRALEQRRVEFEAKNEIEKKKLELRQWLADNPGFNLQKDQATGKVFAINKAHPDQKVDTGTTFDNFSELEKAQYRLREAAVPRTVVTSGTTNSTVTTPPTLAADEKPAETKVRYYNNAKKAVADHPEYAKYVHFGESGAGQEGTQTVTVEPPVWTDILRGDFGKTQEEYNAAVKAIYGDAEKVVKPGSTKTTETKRETTSTSRKGAAPKLAPKDSAARDAAVKILKDNKQPVTEANIAYVMKQTGGK